MCLLGRIKGISGGEMKRLSFASEVKIIFIFIIFRKIKALIWKEIQLFKLDLILNFRIVMYLMFF